MLASVATELQAAGTRNIVIAPAGGEEWLQRELSGIAGISGRLLRRRDDETTWMEIYENVQDGARFEAELAKLVERHGLAALLVPGSPRKQEVFRAF